MQRRLMYSLKDKTVLITGGSAGVGAATAKAFAARGANIIINYANNATRADDLATRIGKEFNVLTSAIQADMGSEADVKRLVDTAVGRAGGLDIVVANAGWTKVATDFSDLHAYTMEEWTKIWTLNCVSHTWLLREAKPTLKANADGGAFLITSSIAGVTTSGSSLAYCMAKAASVQMTKCLAKTEGPQIRVNAVLPGLLDTEWSTRFEQSMFEDYVKKAPLKRLPTVEDCAAAFVSLAENTSMTGQLVQVDGGKTLYT